MNILDELGKLVEDDGDDFEEVRPMKRMASKISSDDNEGGEDSSGDEEASTSEAVGELLKHIEAVSNAAAFLDRLTPKLGAGDTVGFEAEISLRKSIERMTKLSDLLYKKKK
jgi:hypothetical protein